jgi:hypothetical protein
MNIVGEPPSFVVVFSIEVEARMNYRFKVKYCNRTWEIAYAA